MNRMGLLFSTLCAVNWKILYHSPVEISGNSRRNFLSNGKRPKTDNISEVAAEL